MGGGVTAGNSVQTLSAIHTDLTHRDFSTEPRQLQDGAKDVYVCHRFRGANISRERRMLERTGRTESDREGR